MDYNKAHSIGSMTGNTKEVYPDKRKKISPDKERERRFRRIHRLIKNQRKK